jgi:hypothetical protein
MALSQSVTDMAFWAHPESLATEQANADLTVESSTSFTLRVTAQDLTPGHAITIWAFDGTGVAGGLVTSGVVGNNGRLTVGGDNCIGAAQTENGLGVNPGTPPACALLDLSAPKPEDLEATFTGFGLPDTADDDWVSGLNIFLLDHGAWEGNAAALQTTEGQVQTHGAFRFDLSGRF